jgi:hypothetical protein
MRTAVITLSLLCLPLSACKKSQLVDAADAKFKIGQRWSYWARPGEEQSTLTVEKIDSHPAHGVMVHIGLDNLQLKLGDKTAGLLRHVVFSREAMEKSVAKVIEEDAPVPPYQPEYAAWKKQIDEGGGQVYTQPVADTLNAMEKAAAEPPPPAK